jgi:hypothetical protein
MLFTDDRNKTPSKYSIKTIQARNEWEMHGHVHSYLSISLEPARYHRNRFEGKSYEKKKFPAELRIAFGELLEMAAAMTRGLQGELDVCYQVLSEHGLMGDVSRKHQEGNPQEGTDAAQKPGGPI